MPSVEYKPANEMNPLFGRTEPKQKSWILPITKFALLCGFLFVLVAIFTIVIREEHTRQYTKAAVATDVPECSVFGRSVLKDGGSAVDAAITSMLCVGVINGQSSGISGGFHMLVYDRKTKEMAYIDARNSAPAAATPGMFIGKKEAQVYGALTIAIPGELKGMWEAHQRYGKLPWKKLFEPAIKVARNGFRLTKHGVMSLGMLKNSGEGPHMKAWRDLYFKDNGTRFKEVGDMVIRSKYADTLQRIADNGWTEFYLLSTADMFIEDMKTYNGIITKADLGNYSVRWSKVLETSLMGYSVFSPSLPSSGPIYQFIINVMKGFDIDLSSEVSKVKTYHRFLETSKFAVSLKGYLGDMDTPEIREVLNKLASEDYASKVRNAIKDDRVTYRNASEYGNLNGDRSDKLGSTSHISVLDENGNAVSVTTTINYYFGAKIMSTTSGIIYNNLMTAFKVPSSERDLSNAANYPAPFKRPFSCISGSILLDENDDVRFIVGSSGGKKIALTNAWVTLIALSTDLSLTEATEGRRIANAEVQEAIYEAGFSKILLEDLIDLGHVVVPGKNHSFAVVQAIIKDERGIDAHSDSRKQGKAAGY